MSYIEGNKEAWEEAFEHRQPNWGDENYIRLLNEKLPFFDENAAEELQKIHFAGKDIAQFCCNNGRELLSLVKNGANSGVGFDIAEKQVTGIKILSQAETPGLGANCANTWFAERYMGKSAAEDLAVVKVETTDPGEVQAITAATITSNGVTAGVNAARQDFAANYGSL